MLVQVEAYCFGGALLLPPAPRGLYGASIPRCAATRTASGAPAIPSAARYSTRAWSRSSAKSCRRPAWYLARGLSRCCLACGRSRHQFFEQLLRAVRVVIQQRSHLQTESRPGVLRIFGQDLFKSLAGSRGILQRYFMIALRQDAFQL